MTGQDVIDKALRIINATPESFSSAMQLDAVNYGNNLVSHRRIAMNDPDFIFPLSIVNGQDEPVEFVKFAGTNPIEIRDLGTGRKWYYTGSVMPSVKYYRMRPQLAALSDAIYHNYRHCEAVKLATAIYLNESRGYNMAQERARLDEMLA